MSNAVRKADLEYYEPITDPSGPAMTESMYAIGWLELGEKDKAVQSFFSSQRNMQPPFDVWSETANPNDHDFDEGISNFITGAGGFLQSVINGYGGVRVRENEMIVNPSTYVTGWKGMKLRGLHYRNAVLDISWNSTTTLLLLAQCEAKNTTSCAMQVGRPKPGTIAKI